MRYYIDPDHNNLKHIYLEHEMGVKWIATVTSAALAVWLLDQLNNKKITYEVPSAKDGE